MTIPGALAGVEGWLADHRDSCVDWGPAHRIEMLDATGELRQPSTLRFARAKMVAKR